MLCTSVCCDGTSMMSGMMASVSNNNENGISLVGFLLFDIPTKLQEAR